MQRPLTINTTEVAINLNGVNYILSGVHSIAFESMLTNNLVRGSDARDKQGIVVQDGTSEADSATLTIRNVSAQIFSMMENSWKNASRLTATFTDSKTGDRYVMRDSILTNRPLQKSISDGADQVNIEVVLKSFNLETKFKVQ